MVLHKKRGGKIDVYFLWGGRKKPSHGEGGEDRGKGQGRRMIDPYTFPGESYAGGKKRGKKKR